MGYAHYPAALSPLLSAVRSAASNTYSCAPAPMQRALTTALQPEHADELDGYTQSCNRVLKAVGDFCSRCGMLEGWRGTRDGCKLMDSVGIGDFLVELQQDQNRCEVIPIDFKDNPRLT